MLGEWKLPHVQETFSCKTTFFQMNPSSRKLQESENRHNKINKMNRTHKLCTLATNNLILSQPATHP